MLRERRDGGARFPFVLDAYAFAAARVTSRDADFFTEAGGSPIIAQRPRGGRVQNTSRRSSIAKRTAWVNQPTGAYVR